MRRAIGSTRREGRLHLRLPVALGAALVWVLATAPTLAAADGLPLGLAQQGSDDAPVTIVAFSDYQCPFCGRVGPTLARVQDRYGPAVRVVWANLPLPFHKDAEPAARAVLAAERQGAFAEMHERMFAQQRQLSPQNFETWAGELGLDVERFKRDMADPKLGAQIQRETAMAHAVGARGTPNFFINGAKLTGAQPFEKFADAIDGALRTYGRLSDTGLEGRALLDATWKAGDAKTGPLLLAMLLDGKDPPAPPPRPTATRAPTRDETTVWQVPLRVEDHVRGPDDAPVTIVVWTDLQCPFCARANRTIDKLFSRYQGKLRYVLRHHPLPFHKQAPTGHRALLAAAQQGKFWPFHDAVWDHQRDLTDERMRAIATNVGLDLARFDAALQDADALNVRIDADMAAGRALGVQGTPNFFVNGRSLRGAQPEAKFAAMIDEELAKHAKGRKAFRRWKRKEKRAREKAAARARKRAYHGKRGTPGIAATAKTPTWYEYLMLDAKAPQP